MPILPIVLLQPLSDITATASDGEVQLTCRVQAQSLHWYVNDTWYSSFTAQLLLKNGFYFSNLVHENHSIIGSVTIDVSARNINNTILECYAENDVNETISTTSTVLIAGIT